MTSLFYYIFGKPYSPPFRKKCHTKFWCGQAKRYHFFIRKFVKKNQNSEYMGLWVSREYLYRSPNIFFHCIQWLSLPKTWKNQARKLFVGVFFYMKPIFFKNCKKCCFLRVATLETATKKINSWLYIFFSAT